jgi:Dolichyl-phosphate-mannose-protein mannosyltransferase
MVLVALGIAARVVWALRNGASFDESFTAMIGRRSLGDIFSTLRSSDSHPPLDYLIRAPLARAGVTDFVLRVPSLLFSCAALVLFAWWMRQRDMGGVVAVAVMAVSPFQIMYGGEARMYALLELLGVSAAVIAERWARDPRRWHAAVAGALVLVAIFDHVSGFLLAGGLLAFAGVRTDREAWRWRAYIAGALALWAVTWGSSFLVQASTTHASWIDRTTPRSVVEVVSGLVTNQQGVALVVLLIVAAGVVRLVITDRVLGRLVICMGLLPIAAAAVIGLFTPFFIERAVTVAAWAPCVAVGVVVEGVWRRSRAVGAVATVLVCLMILPATVVFLERHWEYDSAAARLTAVTRAGDTVATVPGWYGPLVDWRVGARDFGSLRTTAVPGLPHAHAIIVGGRPASGTVWVLSFAGDHRHFSGVPHCAPDWTDGVTVVSCLRVQGMR